MSDCKQIINLKGKQISVSAIEICGMTIILTGKIFKYARIHDEVWLESKTISNPIHIIDYLINKKDRPDVFTFAQRLPDLKPHFPFPYEWENIAVATIESYSSWFERQVDRSVRKHIRKSQREGIVTKTSLFDDSMIKGICSIYNEQKYRQGRKFWHYGKSFEEVRRENGTYLDRSVFIGAYYGEELIGFIKFVVDDDVATMMQILSKSCYFNKRPTNALLSKAIDVCNSMGIKYLIYGEHTYAKKNESTLIDFKEKNGFKKIEYPRYYVPLTTKGQLAVRLGLYKGWQNLLPSQITKAMINLRSKYYSLRMNQSSTKSQTEKTET